MTTRLCRDCRWCKYPGNSQSPCHHDVASRPPINIVTGQPDVVGAPIYCAMMRRVDQPCGREARLFEPRDGVVVPPVVERFAPEEATDAAKRD